MAATISLNQLTWILWPLLLWARAYETIRSKGYVTLLGRQEHA